MKSAALQLRLGYYWPRDNFLSFLIEDNPPFMTQEAGRITINNKLQLQVPDHPIIPFIEGDGTGRDIWRASVRVFDAAVAKAYGGTRKIQWKEVLAGEKAFTQVNNWLPDETLDAFRTCLVGIKGPLTTPVGGGIRSLNVALRQILDLYVCLRPVRWYQGVPSPVKHPEKVDMVIFRENTEDITRGSSTPPDRQTRRRSSISSRGNFRRSSRKSDLEASRHRKPGRRSWKLSARRSATWACRWASA